MSPPLHACPWSLPCCKHQSRGVFAAHYSGPGSPGTVGGVTLVLGVQGSRRQGRSQAGGPMRSSCSSQKLVQTEQVFWRAHSILEPSPCWVMLACRPGSELEGRWLTMPNHDHHHDNRSMYSIFPWLGTRQRWGNQHGNQVTAQAFILVLELQTLPF